MTQQATNAVPVVFVVDDDIDAREGMTAMRGRGRDSDSTGRPGSLLWG